MKSLFVSLMLVVFAQGAHAAPFALNDGLSKKLYNILAGFGLREDYPATMQTREWAHPAVCVREINMGVSYTCLVHDEIHNVNLQKTGVVAKNLYHFIKSINGDDCEGRRCLTRTEDIKCIYWWPNKDNPPERRYACLIDKISAGARVE